MAKLTQLFHEPGALLNDFVVDWSKDNKIAVATQHAVCVYEVKCKPHEKELTAAGVFAKILPEKEQNLCFGKDLPFMGICREKMQRITDMFTDTGLMAVTTNNDTFVGFRRALWSPPGMASFDSCLLATLSWDRRLKIYEVQSAKPRLVTVISDQWIQNHADLAEDVVTLTDVRRRTYELSIVDMAWTGMSEGENGVARCHLVTVTRSGHLAVWRVTAGSLRADLVAQWVLPDPDDRVTCLAWLESGALLLGRQSGRLLGYGLSLTDRVTHTPPWTLLADEDQLPVSCVVAADTGADPPLLLAKGFAVMALRLTRSGDAATVTGSAFVRLEGAQVTGMAPLSPGCAIVSTLYNQFWTVRLEEGEPLALRSAPISVLLEPVHYSCHALATSPSRVIICTVERVFDYYDHLQLREPVRVSFTLLEQPLDQLLNSVLNSRLPLRRLTDVLEAARLTMLVDKTPFSLLEGDEALSRQSARHLQSTLFMACSSHPLQKPGDAAAPDLDRYAELLRVHLLRGHLARALERPGAAAGPFQKRARAVLAAEPAELGGVVDAMPACGICQQGVSALTSLEAMCEAGHRLPVCCQTAALCDTVPYRRCEQCGAFALNDTVAETGLGLGPWCTFCDGRLSSSL
ncbi:uncharacterized protein LOC119099427 isoform X2 [Pollicipes pollicipes]|uniref:uncharacterized protein LOC119099427 isoform X2 n=1 Tax=Pollicipes pollicipes TaxID=41117 RepID=UPI001884E361|nr:uncharacterized protein LOC119099427 isoform X2 [Pollicipes pollicipes]